MQLVDDIKKIKSGKKELRDFGFTVGGVLFLLGGVMLWRHKSAGPYLLGAGAILAVLGLAAPAILKPLQKFWMALSVVIGSVMSRVILSIVFYGVVTPIGLIMRVTGKDILDQRIDKSKDSYWKDVSGEIKTKESYEKQF